MQDPTIEVLIYGIPGIIILLSKVEKQNHRNYSVQCRQGSVHEIDGLIGDKHRLSVRVYMQSESIDAVLELQNAGKLNKYS
ncbi:hypothetical protein BJY01DRAFT_82742 [Aspergillus pseudoustus]|uniref:Uncharacterized protein n=1 Tax=Aspergillus pseudoustus TaxID=1810923 RepID=A0ABR4KKV6_9EURO